MSTNDKEKQKEYSRQFYLKHKERFLKECKERNAVVKARNKEILKKYFNENPCVDCGETDHIVLEFDHVRGEKSFNVANRWPTASIKLLENEIAKCEVRCANCHRRVTHKRRLMGAGCEDIA